MIVLTRHLVVSKGSNNALAAARYRTMLTGLLLRLVAVYSAVYLLATGELYEGSQCSISKGSGVCQLLNDQCPSVYRDLISGKPPELICGYEGTIPIVCCPSDDTQAPGSATTRRPIWGSDSSTTSDRPFWARPTRPTTSNSESYRWNDKGPTTTDRRTTTIRRPTTAPTNPLANARPARRMCAEYAKSVYHLTVGPVLTLDRQYVNESLCAIKSKKLIVGGAKAEPKEFPHMAAIGYNNGSTIHWSCAGSLVSDQFVVTAAHCLQSNLWGPAKWVRVGDLNLHRTDDDAKPQDRRVAERIKHPNYKRPARYHDIALLRLESPVTFNAYVRPACLDVKGKHGAGQRCVATGWGTTEFQGEASDDLLKVTLPIVSHEKCRKLFSDLHALPNGIVEETQFCAGENQKDTCQGDSGGPLAIYSANEECMYDVIGVTSFGASCGLAPGVYTRIFHYLSWMENIIWAA